MRILRSTDYRRMPWKNGKGETVEIAVFPPDAAIDDFDWRISMATVAEDGPFSVFDGIDRTLSVLSGDGIRLLVDGQGSIDLFQHSAPHSFPADTATSARLLGGPITDLNIMTRRGLWRHHVSPHITTDGPFAAPENAFSFILALDHCRTTGLGGGEGTILERFDTLALAPGEGGVAFTPDYPAQLLITELEPAMVRQK
nr:HutD family protein [Rhizobium terrae]